MANHPRILCLVLLAAMWAMAQLGVWLRRRFRLPEEDSGNLSIMVPATLTLLGLIIGFTFSMATTHYDQRKLYEEGEANAIGTEYVRAGLLPASQAAGVRQMLLQYLDQRIVFYHSGYGAQLRTTDAQTAALQAQLWASIEPQAVAQPNPVIALVVSGMNDVLNSQGYTQFSWWNRIPLTAWALMVIIALFANGLLGYGARGGRDGWLLLLVLPLMLSISFFLVANVDSPRGGIVRVAPVDLIALSQQLHAGKK